MGFAWLLHRVHSRLVSHPSREGGSGDFTRSLLKFTPFRQKFQTANGIIENSILSLLEARRFKFLLQLRISFHTYRTSGSVWFQAVYLTESYKYSATLLPKGVDTIGLYS